MTAGLRELLRPELRDLAGYPAAAPDRDLVRLHANEAPDDPGALSLNRYPEPQPQALLGRLAELYGVGADSVLATRGSDDAIDLLVRCFCRAGEDAIVICPPTFGMYAMAARLQHAAIVEAGLDPERGFAVDADAILAACTDATRLVFLCSPNNPTGNLVPADLVLRLCNELSGRALVAVDEAYIEFARAPSISGHVTRQPNLVVLRTLSKAFALAGARCGALIATPELIDIVRPAMPPYPLPTPTIRAALAALADPGLATRIERIRDQRVCLREALERMPAVIRTWPSEGNFILAEVNDPDRVLDACRRNGFLIRGLGGYAGLQRHVRITVGTGAQNRRLVEIIGALP